MNRHGFTMLELTITMGLLSVVSLLMFVAVWATTQSVEVAEAKTVSQGGARDVLSAIQRDIELAARADDDTVNPPIAGFRIVNNPVAGSPVEIVFQRPLNGGGWSAPVRYRHMDEDANGNAHMDAGEDLDGDGILQRCVLRVRDLNDDGDFADDGEQAVVGAVNCISDVQFAFDGEAATVTVTSERLIGNRRTNPTTTTLTRRVYLMN